MLAKRLRFTALICSLLLVAGWLRAAPATSGGCRRVAIEGEVTAGRPFLKPMGGGLTFFLQPIASGWILRVIPTTGPRGEHDYAELATPPYHSVTQLSVSTDFAFRAQDAVGWNPRRFRFATTQALFDQLLQVYRLLPAPPASAPAAAQQQLGSLIAGSSEGTFQILDARLMPGTADQTPMAAAVAAHFATTAHTLEQLGPPTPLGKIGWLRFRAEFTLPKAFASSLGLKVESVSCPLQP